MKETTCIRMWWQGTEEPQVQFNPLRPKKSSRKLTAFLYKVEVVNLFMEIVVVYNGSYMQ
jgi:hypothetical protein